MLLRQARRLEPADDRPDPAGLPRPAQPPEEVWNVGDLCIDANGEKWMYRNAIGGLGYWFSARYCQRDEPREPLRRARLVTDQ